MQNPRPLLGIALMVSAMACFSAMNTAIGWLSESGMVSQQMVFLRNAASLCLITLIITCMGTWKHVPTKRLGSHAWRSGIGFISMELWFYSLTLLPLTLATALSFTTPIFATVLAVMLLKEKAGWRRWSAIFLSFIGVLIVLNPGSEALNPNAPIVLVSSSLMALAGILVKALTRTERPETIVFYMALFMTPLSLPLAWPHMAPVSMQQWAGIAFVALTSTGAHLLLARAYRYTDMVVLLPFDFTRLLFTGLFAFMLFGERMTLTTFSGALLIMACTIYIAHRETLKKSVHPAIRAVREEEV